jgi:hypothetical protein
MKHPLQPLYLDEQGRKRFKPNAIVQHLLDNGGIDMNQLACMDFTQEDREQFAQLTGYSLAGFGELSYVSDATYELASGTYDATYEAPLRSGHTVYGFEVNTIDRRTNQRQIVCVTANSKASAGKLLRELGYTINDMSFI